MGLRCKGQLLSRQNLNISAVPTSHEEFSGGEIRSEKDQWPKALWELDATTKKRGKVVE